MNGAVSFSRKTVVLTIKRPLCTFLLLAETESVNQDIRVPVEKLFFTVQTHFPFQIGNRHDARSHTRPKGPSHSVDFTGCAAGTALKTGSFHIERFDEISM